MFCSRIQSSNLCHQKILRRTPENNATLGGNLLANATKMFHFINPGPATEYFVNFSGIYKALPFREHMTLLGLALLEAQILHNENIVGQPKKKNETCIWFD